MRSHIMAGRVARTLLRLPVPKTGSRLRPTVVACNGSWRAASSSLTVTLSGNRSTGESMRTALPLRKCRSGRGLGNLLGPGQSNRGLTSGVDYTTVNMPALSPTMESGTITQWHKAPGDELAAGDVICDVETDKATVAFDVQDDGVLAKIISEAGSGEVLVGAPVAVIVEDAASFAAFAEADAAGEVVLDGTGGTSAPSGAEPPAEVEAGAAAVASDGLSRTVSQEYLFMPAARHMAQSKKIDASSLMGTGKGGRITKGDIIDALGRGVVFPDLQATASAAESISKTAPAPSAAAAPAAAASPTESKAIPSSNEDYVDQPANNIKKVTAKRLTQSKSEVPHMYVSMACEVDGLMALRKKLQKEHDVKVSVNDFIIRSAALALRDVPEANAMWTRNERRPGDSVDISVAVATPTGLITPIVTNADRRGLSNINAAVKDLATRARDRLLKPEEFQGGSFTVSNLGMFGINEFSAVINMPQACILAVGVGSPTVKPGRAKGDKPRVCSEVTVRLSADRRVVDEAIAAQLLQSFKHYMEKPELLLM